MADAKAPCPPKEPVPPEEEVPPLSSSSTSWCRGGGGCPSDMDDCCCDKEQVVVLDMCDPQQQQQQQQQHDIVDDNLSSSLQRQVDDLFDRYGLSPVPSETASLPEAVDVSSNVHGGTVTFAPLSPLSFHASLVGAPSFESGTSGEFRNDGDLPTIPDVDGFEPSSRSNTPPPAFRVRVVTSSSTVTVELVADDGSWSVEQKEWDSGEEEEEDLKTFDIGDVVSFGSHHRQSRTSEFSRLVWLVPATHCDGSRSAPEVMGIEVVPRKRSPDDISCGPSTTCSETTDEASAVLRLAPDGTSQPEECDEAVTRNVATDAEDRSDPSVALADNNENTISTDDNVRFATHVLASTRNESALPTNRRVLINEALESTGDDRDETSGTIADADDATERPEPSATPDTTSLDDTSGSPPDSEGQEPAMVERGQSILDAADEMEDEKLEDAIILSFESASDVDRAEAPPVTTSTSVALVEHQPAKTTARRVRSLLNGMFEIDDSDGSEAAAGQHVQVKNVVQRIEEKMVVRRRTVTENRHFKVSRTKVSDEGSDSSRTAGSAAKAADPVNLTCRLILRLASSDTESDASTSEDSSTLTGSYLLSVGATDMTQGGESERMEEVQSFVMMFRQLKAVETRQERSERRFQRIYVGPSEREAKDDEDKAKRVAARCTRLAERLTQINGTQIILPDESERLRLEAEYRRLEKELEQYGAAFMLSQIHRDEQESLEAKWESDNHEMNCEALKSVRRHLPVNVRTMAVSALTRTLTPNGKVLPENVARKFKASTTILQLLRIDPSVIERMHPSVLEELRMVDLTLVERRALHCHLKDVGAVWEKRKAGVFSERRWAWFQMLKSNFKEELALSTLCKGGLDEAEQDDPDDELSTAGRGQRFCTLLNPESDIDYQIDYGFPDGDVYELLSSPTQTSGSNDFASTLRELQKTENEADEVDFFAPLMERMKGLDDEAVQFQNEIATLEDTIRSLGICHSSLQRLESGKEISSSESSSTASISS